jgi:hypothetical protein
MKKYFYTKSGDPKWAPYWIGVLVFFIIALLFLGGDAGLAFKRFFRAGLWMILGPAAGGYFLYNRIMNYKTRQEFKNWYFALAVGLSAIGLLGPLVSIRADRASNIPDEEVLFYNGKVINAWYADKPNYYFRYYELSPEDSLYVVTFSEEPGLNIRHAFWNCDTCPRSTAPRANEFGWTKTTRRAEKLKDKY